MITSEQNAKINSLKKVPNWDHQLFIKKYKVYCVSIKLTYNCTIDLNVKNSRIAGNFSKSHQSSKYKNRKENFYNSYKKVI